MKRWRQQGGVPSSGPLWTEWEQLLGDECATLERAALADSDHGQLMRSVSPLGAWSTSTSGSNCCHRRVIKRHAMRLDEVEHVLRASAVIANENSLVVAPSFTFWSFQNAWPRGSKVPISCANC